MNIQNLSDEVLSAYLDGELTPQERTALERQLAGEPGARVRLDRFRENDARLRKAFAVPSSPASDPLLQLLRKDDATPAEDAIPAKSFDRRARFNPYAMPGALAMAATVAALAVGLGWHFSSSKQDAGNGPILSAELRTALDGVASGQERASARMLLSFRRHDGTPCRQFEVANGKHSAEGVACRGGADRWQLVAWHEMPMSGDGYRTAGADASVDALVDKIDATGPLSPEEEKRLIREGW